MLFLRLFWQVPAVLLVFVILVFLVNECAVARPSRRVKDVPYVAASEPDFDAKRHVLDVYVPRRNAKELRPVVLFIHGGNWDSGSKNLYWFVGRRLAKQGVVAVVISYRLAPAIQVPGMADDCARALRWVQRHIAELRGDPARIFVMGHSAGGGLAALLATDQRLLDKWQLPRNVVKGAILDDPAGLDMFDYLKKMEYPGDDQYLVPFGQDSTVWRAVSPYFQVTAQCPPMLIYTGSRTYPSIASSTQKFHQRLRELGVKHEYKILPGKKHIGMVTQLFWQKNLIYRELLPFVGASSE
ncbi:alpha/beta hydrolase [Larkinella insperata]|uniref:Alpha/beta hydrolase n=1 Tax=Larkinella insperata TaxID=332158 RepID=A0ABW3QHM5_9BACT|nr:alpha/beta hydrolase [Larkinella insperata]